MNIRHHPTWLRFAIGIGACATLAAAQSPDAERVDATRSVLEKWVETQRIITQERRDWTLGAEMLSDRIALVKNEIASLRTRIDQTKASLTEADAKKLELVAQREQLAEASSSLRAMLFTLELQVRELLLRLPDPIRERVEPLSNKLPEEGPSDREIRLGERFQNIVGILNEVDKFNREITVTSEVRTLGDGSVAEVATLYVGVGQAYYVTTRGDAAGIGTPSPYGWVWTPADAAAPAIAEAIGILKNERPAAFVRLPIAMLGEEHKR